ncbi:MAG: helix-turn-helix domain-containing protein [Arachnia propionica]|uniref:helix-turn-helix domain-containing protein n=1 Tax=Arachnia propionica TaxID=1750 RepID=UPI0026FD1298|nr:helix-turn-helix domain-containing protein [Arachnia propionica]
MKPLPLATAWETVGAAQPGIIPADGCMDLVTDGETVMVAGPDSRARRFVPRAHRPLWGVRFHPGLLPHLLGVPAQQLLDQVVPLAAVSRLEITPTQLKAPKTLLTLYDAEADKAMRVARALADGESVVSVAEGANWSTRQLRRLCASWFGYGPKHLQRVLRLREAEERLAQGMSMTDAAASSGYTDASHLWRDRRDLGPD